MLPSLRRPGERFQLGLKAEDAWGNPSDKNEAQVRLESSLPVANLPESVQFERGQKSITCEDLTVAEEGELTIRVLGGNELLAEAGPLPFLLLTSRL